MGGLPDDVRRPICRSRLPLENDLRSARNITSKSGHARLPHLHDIVRQASEPRSASRGASSPRRSPTVPLPVPLSSPLPVPLRFLALTPSLPAGAVGAPALRLPEPDGILRTSAPVAQRIEHWPPEPGAWVRVPPGVPDLIEDAPPPRTEDGQAASPDYRPTPDSPPRTDPTRGIDIPSPLMREG